MRYLYQAQPELEVVAVSDDAAVADAIDERTLLVPISHVLFKNGEIQDVGPIIRRAQEAGAYVVLDCYQSAGVVPFDLTELGVDFAVGGSVKWLCGGPGRRLALRAAGPRGAARADVRRLAGTRAAVCVRARARVRRRGARASSPARRTSRALYAATAGYDVIEEVGVERIRERSLALTQLLIDLCDAAGFEIGSPREPERRGGTVTVSTPSHARAEHADLGDGGRLRLSAPTPAGGSLGPHFFNTEDGRFHRGATDPSIAQRLSRHRHARHGHADRDGGIQRSTDHRRSQRHAGAAACPVRVARRRAAGLVLDFRVTLVMASGSPST